MKRKKWSNWKRKNFTGSNSWETFFHRSRNGKKWYKINYGITTPYDSKLYKYNKF